MLIHALQSIKSKLHSVLNSFDRRAKIQDSDFVLGVVLAVASAKENFSLSDLRRAACNFLGINIGCSAFNERLGTASLVQHLQVVFSVIFDRKLEKYKKDVPTENLLKKLGVSQIIAIDSSMTTLWDGLCKHFKGTFMTASVKLHLAIDLVTGGLISFSMTDGATHDSKRFPEPLTGILYIFDLGYWAAERFGKISKNDAFFLSRIKSNAKLIVTKTISGFGKSIIGQDLLSYPILRKRKSVVELYAEMAIGTENVSFRVIGFWHNKTRSYRWYLTNLKSPRRMIYDLYRLRWQIELSFKAMKSTLNFDRMPTTNPNAVKSFVLIALINYVFATILKAEAKASCEKKTTSIQRAAKTFSTLVRELFQAMKKGRRFTAAIKEKLTEKILSAVSEIFDPNHRKRKTTMGRLLQ